MLIVNTRFFSNARERYQLRKWKKIITCWRTPWIFLFLEMISNWEVLKLPNKYALNLFHYHYMQELRVIKSFGGGYFQGPAWSHCSYILKVLYFKHKTSFSHKSHCPEEGFYLGKLETVWYSAKVCSRQFAMRHCS